jgi:hypothetical protein
MSQNEAGKGFLATLIYFVAWIIAAAGSVIDALGIREAILAILALFKVINQDIYRSQGGVGEDIFANFGLAAVDNFIILILGCGAIAVTIWAEYYFRKGRAKGELYKRIGKVIGIEIAVLVLVLIIRVIISSFLAARG